MCRTVDFVFFFSIVGFVFSDFGLAVVPILKVDSQDERTKFVADFKETIENCNELRIENSSEGENVHFFYSALVACASKPVRV